MRIVYRISLYIFLILNFTTIISQEHIDSLIEQFEKLNSDSTKKIALLNISDLLSRENPQKAFEYIEKLQNLSKNTNDDFHFYRGEIVRALSKARTNKVEESNAILIEMIDNVNVTIDTSIYANIYMNLGLNHVLLGKFEKAIEYFEKSIEECNKYNLKSNLASNYSSLGILNSDLGKMEIAEKFHLSALKIFEELDDKRMIGLTYNNLSTVFTKKSDIESAIKYVNKAIDIYTELDNPQSLGIAYHNKAALYFELNKNDEVIYWLEKSLEMKEKTNNIIGVGITRLGIAETYYFDKKYDLSMKNLKIASKIFSDGKLPKFLMQCYSLEESILHDKGDYKGAYDMLTKYNSIKDSIFDESSNNKINELNAKYEIAQKNIENEVLKNKSDRQFFIIIISSILLLFVIAGIIALYVRNRTIKALNNVLELNKEKIETQNSNLEQLNSEMNKLNTELLKANSELKTLNLTKDKFFSIISHDLKGPISSQNQILNLLHENPNEFQEDEKNEYLNLLYESSKNTYNLLENLLVWGKVQMNGIQVHYSSFDLNEVILRIFENLELSATIKKIELINECPSNYLMNGDIGMISTVIRNITNNSIKFTLSKGRIILNAYNDGDYHHITINDNGIGMTEKSLNNLFRIDVQNSTLGTNNEKGTGLGLIISKEFIEIHNGKLWLESKPGNGTTCHILIPIAIIPEHQKIEYSNPIYLSE